MSKQFAILGFAALAIGACAAPAGAADVTAAQLAAICGQRSQCEVATAHEAGRAEDGDARLVVALRLGLANKPDDAPEDGCRDEGDRHGGMEYWVFNGKKPPVQALALCNDGYGAAGVGEDEVKVEDNRLRHRRYGGSSWRWTDDTVYRLEPLTKLETTDCFFSVLQPGSGTLTYTDLWNMRLRSYGYDKSDPSAAEEIGCPETVPVSSSPRPAPGILGALALPGFGIDQDTRKLRKVPTGAALFDCALSISTDGANGFMVYGQAARQNAAELKIAVESDSGLVLQVFDPLAKANQFAANWVHQPHVELWRAPADADTMGGYGNPTKFEQIGIALDGKVWPGVKAGKLPQIERWTTKDEKARDVVVLRVTWGEESALAWGIAAVYSQAENGRQARMVATTGIERNRPLFLPPARRFDRDCSLQNGLWKLGPLPEIAGAARK